MGDAIRAKSQSPIVNSAHKTGSRRNLSPIATFLIVSSRELSVPDLYSLTNYFQQQAEHMRDPEGKAHYQRCADQYYAKAEEARETGSTTPGDKFEAGE